MGGVGNNGIGITGVAWDVQIMACQFLSPFGFGMTADAIECIDYARQNGAHIMSNSWGGGGFSQALYDAISRARDEDISSLQLETPVLTMMPSPITHPATT